MYEAYQVIPLVQNLTSIETICAYDDYLFVGTKSGTLLLYQLVPSSEPGAALYEAKLLSSNESFSKKAIVQLQVVPEFEMLFCLSDAVTTFDLSQFKSLTSTIMLFPKTKGAHCFATHVQKLKSHIETGEIELFFRLHVAVKKKIQVYYGKPSRDKPETFTEYRPDIALKDIPKTMVWCGYSLCIGFGSEYSLVELSGETKDLFPFGGKQKEPLVTPLPNDRLAVEHEERTIVIDSDGFPHREFICWSGVPVGLTCDSPYLLAVLPSSIEVRSIQPHIHVQDIDLPNAKLVVTSKKGWVFAASSSDVWLLHSVNFSKQMHQFLEQKQFELALQMAEMTDETELEKSQLIKRIENLKAFYLFCEQNFTEAMDLFLKLETDPSYVIGLFPNLLPEELRSSLDYPDTLPNLHIHELENGLLALTNYLVEVRNKLKEDTIYYVPLMRAIANNSGKTKICSKKRLLQIIDTTLFKCYLETNEALIASLLRVKDNYCHIDELERALKMRHKYKELIILYNNKGMHRKALELLLGKAKNPNSPLKGHERTIQYLQKLGNDHLDLIFEYAKWVLKEHPEDGLKIFTEDLIETESLDRNKVFSYLCEYGPDLVIPYLEFIIHQWQDESTIFHNILIDKYCEKILCLLPEYKDSLPEDHDPAPAGEEPGKLGELRRNLLTFLEKSNHYSVNKFAVDLMDKGLYDEGAVVLLKKF